jgi:dihydrofolate reductase/thymidylate synthase
MSSSKKNNYFNRKLNLVVAYTFGKQYIGNNGSIPWQISEDMKHFKEITIPNSIEYPYSIVIMGRKTWDSLPVKRRPLSERINIVLSNDSDYIKKQNLNHDNKMLDSRTGTLFTTWDMFFNNQEYSKIEELLLSKIPSNRQEYIIQAFTYYVIGGAQIYNKAIEMCNELGISYSINATEIYLTKEQEQMQTKDDTTLKYIGDTFFPKIDESAKITSVSPFHKSKSEDNLLYRFITYDILLKNKINNSNNNSNSNSNSNINSKLFSTQENDYLSLMRTILEDGSSNDDRTGVGTLSIFGSMLKYNLRDTFPLCTTKRMFFRAIFEELMFYLSGKTDNKILQEKGIHVWDGNTTREFLDKRGLHHYEEGDMGQTYGFNFRHFGAEYKGCGVDYSGFLENQDCSFLEKSRAKKQDLENPARKNNEKNSINTRELEGLKPSQGYDQLANVIHLIKTEPSSRRIIIDLWDCSTIHKAALPACLCKYQFNVNVTKKELNLAIYLRSSDYFLANNWNSSCGALFVYLLCNTEGIDLSPGELTVFIADAHLYKSHIEQVKINLEREPFPFPKLLIKGEKKKNITEFKFEDIELIGYKAHPNIKAEMAV